MKTLSLTMLVLAASLALAKDDPDFEDVYLEQKWTHAVAASVQKQIEAGARDPKVIREKAIKDTQVLEAKIRARLKKRGWKQEAIDKAIGEERGWYLEDIEAEIREQQKKSK
jgi:hypothetical protein